MLPMKQKQANDGIFSLNDSNVMESKQHIDEPLGMTVDLDTSQRHLIDANASPSQNQYGGSNQQHMKKKKSNKVDQIDGTHVKQIQPAGEGYKSQVSVASSAVQGSYDRSGSLVKLITAQFSMGNVNVKQGQKGDKKRGEHTGQNNNDNQSYDRRQILFGANAPTLTGKGLTNKVRTQRYSWITWAPLSLLFQFKRAANIYFLVISILTTMSFSPKNPASMIGTFAIVLLFTMLKEAYEDYGRYKQDKEVNNKLTLVLNQMTRQFESVKWQDVKVGSIVKFTKDLESPADIMILFSSNSTGFVYVDTMNLDGETNLKEKNCLVEHFQENNVSEVAGSLNCDQPNEALDYWEGQLSFDQRPQKLILANIKNLLLRGCYVRNTEYGIGVVIYTGMQTKIMKNAKKVPHKTSNVMLLMNKMLYTVFAFQIILIMICALLSLKWTNHNAKTIGYLNVANAEDKSSKVQTTRFFIQLLTYWVAYSHMIPISLYVAIELLKLGQAYFVNQDVRMYDAETESFAKCRNSDLIEELGQVEMVFSDKTGTLTQNKMIFKKCQIDGIKYGDEQDSKEGEAPNPNGILQSGANMIQKQIKKENRRTSLKQIPNELDPKQTKNLISTKNLTHTNFARVLAVCHTVVCDKNKHSGHITYQASSPDELALVMGAKQLGIELLAREHGKIFILNNVTQQKSVYKIEAEFPFDSTRKRMSLIVKDESDNYILMCKGADTVMYDRIAYEKSNTTNMRAILEKDLYDYSCQGLRTLVLTQRRISGEEFEKFQTIYNQLMASNNPLKEAKLDELYNAVEQNLRYLGSTAIEDMLQDGVPETIEKLIETDIRFFMLTGDKLETAIEIAKSCRVIQDEMRVIQVINTDRFELHNHFLDILQQPSKYQHNYRDPVKSLRYVKQLRQVIAIDGATLSVVLSDYELTDLFFHASLISKSIVCCRVSPKQKADIVKVFKSRGKWITLAIGDGANDVSMIMEAHIGVGIKGKEGTQAVRSADYAICQFRFLLRLLMVQGRLGYIRVTSLTCYYFYKNIILVFTEIYFSFYNGFSGQIFFLDWLPMIYNTFFTSWQCWFCYLLEQDVTEAQVLRHPTIYKAGQLGAYFSYTIFWKWILLAIWHGLVGFYASLIPESNSAESSSGQMASHWLKSTIAFTIIIHLVCYKLFVESIFWNTISIAAGVISILIYYIVLAVGQTSILSQYLQPELQGVLTNMFSQPKFWLIIVGVPIIQLIPDITLRIIQAVYYPTPAQKIIMEQSLEADLPINKAFLEDSMIYDESDVSNQNTMHHTTQNKKHQTHQTHHTQQNEKHKSSRKKKHGMAAALTQNKSNNSSLRESQEFKPSDNQQAMYEMVMSPNKPQKKSKRKISKQEQNLEINDGEEEISFDHSNKKQDFYEKAINELKSDVHNKSVRTKHRKGSKNQKIDEQEVYQVQSKASKQSVNQHVANNQHSLQEFENNETNERMMQKNASSKQTEQTKQNKIKKKSIGDASRNSEVDGEAILNIKQGGTTNLSTAIQQQQQVNTKFMESPAFRQDRQEEEKHDTGQLMIPSRSNARLNKRDSEDLQQQTQATPKYGKSSKLSDSNNQDQNVSKSLNQLFKQGTRQLEGDPAIKIYQDGENNVFGVGSQSVIGESLFNRHYQDSVLQVEQLAPNHPTLIVDVMPRSPNSTKFDLLQNKSYDIASLGHPLEQGFSLPTQHDEQQQHSKASYSTKKKSYVQKYSQDQYKNQ